MEYLDLLLADRIRVRAGEFRNQARARKRAEIADTLDDEVAAMDKWERETKSDEFIAMAYDELIRISVVVSKHAEPKRKLPTIPASGDEALPAADSAP